MPVLALWGDTDRLAFGATFARGADLRTVILHQCGHMPMVERPAETLFYLRQLLERVSQAQGIDAERPIDPTPFASRA